MRYDPNNYKQLADYREEVQRLEDREDALLQRLREVEGVEALLRERIANLTDRNQNQRAEFLRKDAKIAELEDRIEGLSKALQSRMMFPNDAVSRMFPNDAVPRKRLEEAEAKIAELRVACKERLEERCETSWEFADLREQIESLVDRIGQLMKERDYWREKAEDAEKRVKELQAEILRTDHYVSTRDAWKRRAERAEAVTARVERLEQNLRKDALQQHALTSRPQLVAIADALKTLRDGYHTPVS